MTTQLRPTFLAILILVLTTGCAQLQAGYYLTPGNLPTLPPGTATPVTPSPTPPSTLQNFPTITLTPLNMTEGPTATLTPSPTETLVPCNETEGQMVQASFFSAQANHEVRYRVYLPPCYTSTERRYPYIIMMHGYQGEVMNDDQWDRLGLDEAANLGYQRGSLPPMIIVMPNGNDANHGWDAGNYPEVIVDELMPTIESSFCTWNDRLMRGIGGLSRGGYWAYWIAFSNPDLFSRVGGHSAFFYDAEFPSDKNPNNIVDSVEGIDSLTLYFDHGAQDQDVDFRIQDFVNRLRRRGIEPSYVVNPVGAHVEDYWESHTADYLAFYSTDWLRDITQYPSCHEPSP